MTWFLIGGVALAAGVVGYLVGRHVHANAESAVGYLPAERSHLVDLVRRAHRALVATSVTLGDPPITALHPRGVDRDIAERAEALARLALSDGRNHVINDSAPTLATADGDVAFAVVLSAGAPIEASGERVLDELRALAAGLDAQRRIEREGRRSATRLAKLEQHDSIESASAALSDAATRMVDAPAAVALRDGLSGTPHILAVSGGADRRLLGTAVAPNSTVGRAVDGETPLAGFSAEELFGHFRSDRRRREDAGIAFPLNDGKEGVGALVVFRQPKAVDDETQAALQRLAIQAGPFMARLVSIRKHELRAMTDELTGLPNRRGFESALSTFRGDTAALLYLDLDRFKLLNDTHGHIAGDAALQHLARLLRRGLRERDVAARMGGEEFALWLPDIARAEAIDVAERVRATVEGAPVNWNGKAIPFTCSIGVATMPETTTAAANLYAAADAALYRAKEGGRNKVELARGPRQPRATDV
ncbi:MAG TPA: GGDEF domain-containing protein [Gemmatimonadales bacterium]